MRRTIIEVPVISRAIRDLGAPTSALVRGGGLLFTCGMPPIDIATGAIVSGDIESQTRAVMAALRFTLGYAGVTLDDVLKATVYVTDPALMPGVNRIYREAFGDAPPARTSAAIKPWSLPFDVEIECVAVG